MYKPLKSLAKQSGVYGFAGISRKLVSFLLIPLYTRFLTPANYGVLEILHVSAAVLTTVLSCGMGTTIFKFYYDANQETERRITVTTATLFLTALSVVAIGGLYLGVKPLERLLLANGGGGVLVSIVLVTSLLNVATVIPLAILRARRNAVRFAAITLASFVVGTVSIVFFVVVLNLGIKGVLLGNLVLGAITMLLLAPVLFRSLGRRLDLGRLTAMLRFGLPLVPSLLAGQMLTLADRYFLRAFSTMEELGLYTLGYKFGLIISLVAGAFQTAWLPALFSFARRKDAERVYARVLTYSLAVTVFLGLALSLVSREVIVVMSPPPFYGAYRVVPLIALSYVIHGAYFVIQGGIYLKEKTVYKPFLVGGAALLNLLLNYLLIPPMGMMGAAAATVLSYAALAVATFVIADRLYPVRYEWGRIAKLTVIAAGLYVAGLLIPVESIYVRLALKIALVVLFPLLLYATGFFKGEEMTKFKEIGRGALGWLRARLKRGRK